MVFSAALNPKLVPHPASSGTAFPEDMATISKVFSICLEGGKPVYIPEDLIQELDDQAFLKFRPSSHKIMQLVLPNPKKNASLTHNDNLLALKTKRNEAAMTMLNKRKCDDTNENTMGLQANTKKKSKVPHGDMVCTIDVAGVACDILYSHFRGDTSDLLVSMQPTMIAAVCKCLSESCQDMTSMPAERKAKRKASDM